MAVNAFGNIEWLIPDVDSTQVQSILKDRFKRVGRGAVQVEFIELDDGEFLLPGFVDTHTVHRFATHLY